MSETVKDGLLGLAFVVTLFVIGILALAVAECVTAWWGNWRERKP